MKDHNLQRSTTFPQAQAITPVIRKQSIVYMLSESTQIPDGPMRWELDHESACLVRQTHSFMVRKHPPPAEFGEFMMIINLVTLVNGCTQQHF